MHSAGRLQLSDGAKPQAANHASFNNFRVNHSTDKSIVINSSTVAIRTDGSGHKVNPWSQRSWTAPRLRCTLLSVTMHFGMILAELRSKNNRGCSLLDLPLRSSPRCNKRAAVLSSASRDERVGSAD